jgi:hypothetical protein
MLYGIGFFKGNKKTPQKRFGESLCRKLFAKKASLSPPPPFVFFIAFSAVSQFLCMAISKTPQNIF